MTTKPDVSIRALLDRLVEVVQQMPPEMPTEIVLEMIDNRARLFDEPWLDDLVERAWVAYTREG